MACFADRCPCGVCGINNTNFVFLMTLCCRQHKLGGFFGRGDSVPVALADIIPPPFQGSSFWWRLRPRVPLPPSLMRYGVASRGAEFRRPVGAWFRVVDLPPGFRFRLRSCATAWQATGLNSGAPSGLGFVWWTCPPGFRFRLRSCATAWQATGLNSGAPSGLACSLPGSETA